MQYRLGDVNFVNNNVPVRPFEVLVMTDISFPYDGRWTLHVPELLRPVALDCLFCTM